MKLENSLVYDINENQDFVIKSCRDHYDEK